MKKIKYDVNNKKKLQSHYMLKTSNSLNTHLIYKNISDFFFNNC
jgi:hypothetical protein